MLKPFVFFLFSVMLIYGFTSFSYKTGKKDAIEIGTGGGFSGLTTIYIIDYKGNVFLESGAKDESKTFGKISGKDLSKIRKEIKKSGFYDQTLNDPGNIYYYIETVCKGKNYKVTWGGQQSEEAKKMQTLYNFILEKIKQAKNKI